jgi:murein DD-endopeptidase MepM/ murein hydrolase activator NlpD
VVFSKVFTRASTLFAAALFSVAPAYANSSASADITAPLRTAQEAKPSALGTGDAQFRQLFSDWRSLDKVSAPLAAAAATAVPAIATRRSAVSIPSRMPVEGTRLSSSYGLRTHPVLGGTRKHNGVDLASPTGTPIYATADGLVSKAEWFSSYGNYVQLEHGAQIETRYGHMSRIAVSAGQQVKKGDVIGFVGSTGRSTGPHLHYEVRVAGAPVNPIPYMESSELAQAPATVHLAIGGPDHD